MNYFDSEHVYLALPSVFSCLSGGMQHLGGVWRVKRGNLGTFLGLMGRNWWLWTDSVRCPGSQCHRVGSAFSTSGIQGGSSSFYLGFEGFSLALPDSVVTRVFFFFPNVQTLAGNSWCVSFIPFWQDRHSNDSSHRAKHTILIITLITGCIF